MYTKNVPKGQVWRRLWHPPQSLRLVAEGAREFLPAATRTVSGSRFRFEVCARAVLLP